MRASLSVQRVVAAAALLSAAGVYGAERPLRYAFQPGDHLIYERRVFAVTSDGPPKTPEYVDQIQIWVLTAEDDALRVAVERVRVVDGSPQRSVGIVFDTDQLGRKAYAAGSEGAIAASTDLLALVPELPSGVRRGGKWTTSPLPTGEKWTCDPRGSDPRHGGQRRIVFRAHNDLLCSDAEHPTYGGVFWFDPDAGVITRLEALFVDPDRGQRMQSVALLRSRQHHAPTWTALRSREARAYILALRREKAWLDRLTQPPIDPKEVLENTDAVWTAFLRDVDPDADAPFRRLGLAARKRLRRDARDYREMASLGRRWHNRPARDWSLPDFAGETVTSEAARRGVTVECFWTTRDAGAYAAMKLLSSIADGDAGPEPDLVAFCLNRDTVCPRRVAESLSPKIRHIAAAVLTDIEPIPTRPALRVIDAGGVTRRVWLGWPPTGEEIAEVVRECVQSERTAP